MDHPSYSLYSAVNDPSLNPQAEVNSPLAAQLNSMLVGLGGFEPPTSRLSGVRSNQTEL